MTLPVKVTFPITNQNAYEGLFLGEAEELLGKKHFPGVHYTDPSGCTKIKVIYNQSATVDTMLHCKFPVH